MHRMEAEQLQRFPEWRLVLRTYADLWDSRRQQPDSDAWVPRVREVAGVDPSHLAPIHGKLIALGWLKFELSGRDAGVLYQVTAAGRLALSGAEPTADENAASEELVA